MHCDYIYEEPIALVTGMSVVGLDVALTGTDLTEVLASVTLAETDCIITSNDSTTITCTMAFPWTVGTWLPVVRDAKGIIPLDTGV